MESAVTPDDIIPLLNIVAMTGAAVLIATWWETGLKVFSGSWSRIFVLALGLTMFGVGTFMVRGYSMMIREWGMLWLRDSHIPTIGIALQCSGIWFSAISFYMPSVQSHLTPKHTAGIWAGAVTFLILVASKIIF